MRADLALVNRNLCTSRAQAQDMISKGLVCARFGTQFETVKKASQGIEAHVELKLLDDAAGRFVSRGGVKLSGALQHTGLNVDGLRCLDLGQSTGGFTDCLLQAGALSVVGIDVGRDQLHPKLKNHPSVLSLEGVNLKTVNVEELTTRMLTAKPDCLPFDLVVADLSFISLEKVLHNVASLMDVGKQALLLVKPQFELGPAALGKSGIVKDLQGHLPSIKQNLGIRCENCKLELLDFFPCSITGGDGNQEYFAHVRKQN
ncbi:MAG TPA: TlyA family RNA methyltransferase [Limnobacter sp.]|uniref:TlyA family RNA methyltransferase n=1 Tax=Limnobacter sp. TaxID=2003368 RepID=UPI002E33F6E2|nr:TlyA family RNA methyltransferase [Limnobacter sp.]HEX5487195.1 TlyA family RNA methyltransferase [Limnobacter sp.]